MAITIKEDKGFQYIDEGEGEVLLLLHGLYGALSNWSDALNYFSKRYRVVIPLLPIYYLPEKQADVEGLTDFVADFCSTFNFENVTVLGNSLGGHLGLNYTIKYPENVKHLIITGSSGLYESGMGSFPKRGSYDFIKEKVAYTFYNPKVASKELVDEVYETTKDEGKCLRIDYIARSAQKNNMRDDLHKIKVPTLIIWGLNDTITPPLVAHEFDRKIEKTELHFIDKCCHAPMMEHPHTFNLIVDSFLERLKN